MLFRSYEREEKCEVVKCQRCKMVPEEHVCQVPYTTCRFEKQECVKMVPHTTCHLEPYCVTYKVCRKVPVCVPMCAPECPTGPGIMTNPPGHIPGEPMSQGPARMPSELAQAIWLGRF